MFLVLCEFSLNTGKEERKGMLLSFRGIEWNSLSFPSLLFLSARSIMIPSLQNLSLDETFLVLCEVRSRRNSLSLSFYCAILFFAVT